MNFRLDESMNNEKVTHQIGGIPGWMRGKVSSLGSRTDLNDEIGAELGIVVSADIDVSIFLIDGPLEVLPKVVGTKVGLPHAVELVGQTVEHVMAIILDLQTAEDDVGFRHGLSHEVRKSETKVGDRTNSVRTARPVLM
jgi:hypothetical protein